MTRILLQPMVAAIPADALSSNWADFDLVSFSPTRRLFDYQQNALDNARRLLWKYYEDFQDYTPGEHPQADVERRTSLYSWYLDNGLRPDSLDIRLAANTRPARQITRLLTAYYDPLDGDPNRISYRNFINRMSFWMATGSGKTLVIVKLLQLLWTLIRRSEIPAHDILVLAHRPDLLQQLAAHVDDYNRSGAAPFIRLRDLKDYPSIKRSAPSLFHSQELTVYTYRSDLLNNEQKETILDFRNYDNHGRWYVLLDEAHKGDREDSKRQHIYSILARRGFLFNFSATFVDDRDRVTTALNFNLSEFIPRGYGKHITVMQQEVRAFRRDEDYSFAEKQKIVLKSLLMLSYVLCFGDTVRGHRLDLYHRPLLLTMVNSVNTQDADLKLFFRELARLGREPLAEAMLAQAKAELLDEFQAGRTYLFESNVSVDIDTQILNSLTHAHILSAVFNSDTLGEIEVLVRPGNRQEVAFKLRTAETPFALVKIGDVTGLLKDELAGYEIDESIQDETFFERLNRDDSTINILMGSRSFYEGWDSNRPNVITYINIGTGEEAKKFILQSAGRGVRIEPLKDLRRRLLTLYNAGQVSADFFHAINPHVLPLESLYIFGTNRQAMEKVLSTMDNERLESGWQELPLTLNTAAVQGHPLLIPTYRKADAPVYQTGDQAKFAISATDLDTLARFVQYVDDPRVLLALYEPDDPKQLGALLSSLRLADNFYRQDGRPFRNLDVLICQALRHFGIYGKTHTGWKELEDEINHYRHVRVLLEDLTELQTRVRRVAEVPARRSEIMSDFREHRISDEQMIYAVGELHPVETFTWNGQTIDIRYIAQHYYIPLILTGNPRINVQFMQHIIKHESEFDLIHQLTDYLAQHHGQLPGVDWWMFSKLDETLDHVGIPYYDPYQNRPRDFLPDFIFWLQRGDRYHIVFVDPKGTEHVQYMRKIEGYRRLFEDASGQPRVFTQNGLTVTVSLLLNTPDLALVPPDFRPYWFDNISTILTIINS